MANEEHLRILQQGVDAWNQWRKEHPETLPKLRKADLCRANLDGADLSGVNLSMVNLTEASLRGADLFEANLRGARLTKANLRGANLAHSYLRGADLVFAKLRGANVRAANLREANLHGTDLHGANLRGADLRGADLTQADLLLANIRGADPREAKFGGAHVGGTVFGAVNLGVVMGLESVEHHGPSTIGIDTIYASGGRIPEVFLRGAGVPDELIAYIGSMVGRAIEFYSCFISYSSKDQEFANRLHADLQANGVRCWFAPEDMRTGDKIWDRLDQSIRLHDKLLLILSANSIGSEWVEDEVTTAFEEERRRGKTVLFPVRVDDAVFVTNEPWATKMRQRHIGDFSDWKDHDTYKKAFDRLLRDLKAETPVATARDE